MTPGLRVKTSHLWVVLVLCATGLTGRLPAQQIVLGKTYQPESELKKPATFAFIKTDTGWATKLDAALYLRKAFGGVWVDGGVMAATGNARKPAARIVFPFGALRYDLADAIFVSNQATFETNDGNVETRKIVGARISPLYLPSLAIGVPTTCAAIGMGAPGCLRFRMRPWAGAQFGWVRDTKSAMEGVSGASFWRPHGIVETMLQLRDADRSPAAVAGDSLTRVQLNVKWTGMKLQGATERPWEHLFESDISFYFDASGRSSIKVDWSTGRRSPAFVFENVVGLGLGFAVGP